MIIESMRFSQFQLERIAKDFWSGADPTQGPNDIQAAASLYLRVDIVLLPELSLAKIRVWLEERNSAHVFDGINVSERTLHGFVLNRYGIAAIFINTSDSDVNQRFTIAHEISHFLLDHKLPRDEAILKLGPSIQEVLDVRRKATLPERVNSVLRGIDIGPQSHLLEKEGDGSFEKCGNFHAENDADRLALELLAPRHKVISETLAGSKSLSYAVFIDRCEHILLLRYRLPSDMVHHYAAMLAHPITGGPSILDKLEL